MLKHDKRGLLRAVIAIAILVALIGIGNVSASLRIVPGGHMGVIVTSPGGPSFDELSEGWHLIPWWFGVEIWPYRNQELEMTGETVATEGPEPAGLSNRQIEAVSKDNLRIFIDASLIFRIPRDKVADVRINYGDVIDTIVIPLMRSIPRDVISNFNAFELRGPQRATISQAITVALEDELALHHVQVVRFALRGIRLDESVEDAIAAKKIAEQNVITAELEKQATIIRAEALANSTIIIAAGQAEAVRIITDVFANMDNTTLNAYLTWLFIQALMSADSNVAFVIIIPEGGGVPIILQTPPEP